MRWASAAGMRRPVISSSSAMPNGTSRPMRCVPPAPGMMPRATSGRPKLAVSEATRMSQAIAVSQPPPRAKPLTAAMIGFHISRPR